MAFQSMMNGSECSTSSPLSSLLKQQSNDPSLHSSTFNPHTAGPSLRTRQGQPGAGQAEAERFFQSGNGGNPAFEMERMRRELENVNQSGAMKGDRGQHFGSKLIR